MIRRLLEQGIGNLSDEVHAEVDKILLEEVLNHVDGHQTRAAEVLGISRTTLRARLQQLGITVGKTVQSKDDSES